MLLKNMIVQLPHGLHIRPAKKFVEIARAYRSDVQIGKDDEWMDGRSILELMMMAVDKGDEVTLKIDGDDEADAMTSLESYLTKGEE